MIWNALMIALREIRRNLLRTFLTTLGIVIGVASVITLVTVGNGVTAQVSNDIAKLGSNMLMVRPGQHRGPGGGSDNSKSFTSRDVEAIRREIGSIRAVAPYSSTAMTAVFRNTSWSTQVSGTDNEYFQVKDWPLTRGRMFTDSEQRSGKAVCVIGETVRKSLFGAEDPVGQRIRLQKISFQVIGVLSSKGTTGMGNDQDDIIVIPIRTLQRRATGNQDINMIMISVASGASSEKVQEDIARLLRERRRIGAQEEDNFSIRDMKEIAETMQTTTRMLTALLGAVAAVSLLVGGIGIMNIMLVSVTERTREIGTRMAIGAMERDVMFQFLVEAMALSSLGGLAGITVAFGASTGLVRLLGVPFEFNLGINAIAFVFSAAVGIVFGYFPARRAARLDPIEALRYE